MDINGTVGFSQALYRLRCSAQSIRALAPGCQPKVGIVLGSGLGSVAEAIAGTDEGVQRTFYGNIMEFTSPSMDGHKGELLIGQRTAVLSGRCHPYEEGNPHVLAHHVRTLVWMGCKWIILTNAVGSLTPTLKPGDIALVGDHFDAAGLDPTAGELELKDPDVRCIMRSSFFDVRDLYDPSLRALVAQIAQELGLPAIPEVCYGILQAKPGRRYETLAEIALGRLIGVQTVGMSLTYEALAAFAMGAKVLAINGVSNLAVGMDAVLGPSEITHTQVTDVMEELVAPKLSLLLPALVTKLTAPVPA